jgi:hypothetical protein
MTNDKAPMTKEEKIQGGVTGSEFVMFCGIDEKRAGFFI